MEEGRAFLLVQLENIGRSDEGILNLESIRGGRWGRTGYHSGEASSGIVGAGSS